MLKSLSIRNIVLIDHLELAFDTGLSVLTGETGAGKSILLDSLGLALGGRSDKSLIKAGADRGMVTAVFSLPPRHPVWAIMEEQDLPPAEEPDEIILRRSIESDGRSRAFINDTPVGIAVLRAIGDLLVEVHGQHDDRGLWNSAGHRDLLDAFAGHQDLRDAVRNTHRAWAAARDARAAEEAAIAAARKEEDYIRFSVEELVALDPAVGEEEALAEQRRLMMAGEKNREALGSVLAMLTEEGGVDTALRSVMRRLERMPDLGDGIEAALAALERAANETSDAIAQLEDMMRQMNYSPRDLEATEERLFALRALARKHQVTVDELAPLREKLEAQLQAIDQGADRLDAAKAAEAQALREFRAAVSALALSREKAAAELDKAVARELAPLKLGKAQFRCRLDSLPPEQWTEHGGERVEFEVATNPGAPFGPLMKIASGGEQARFILALKVALARRGTAATLIFDEVDQGIGGAVAEAVGERLARLAKGAQVLVVTHAPQVAAAATHHWRIEKITRKLNGREQANTVVTRLDPRERREEIARMLAGATITDEARAAADKLMQL